MGKSSRLSIFMAISIVGWVMTSVSAETKVFFSSQESVEQELVHLIDQSHTSIEIALFELKSPVLARALKSAQQRGLAVRVVLDASHRQDDMPAGDIRWLGGKNSQGHGVMHNKFALFDQGRVVTGSYNWTPGAEHANYENALLTDDRETVGAYSHEFESLWERASIGPDPSPTSPKAHKNRMKPNRPKSVRIKAVKVTKKHRHKT
jgi:phosphatidylserine/phosphatidylglycerophosphate/cardiolipin synthase-like enzyme